MLYIPGKLDWDLGNRLGCTIPSKKDKERLSQGGCTGRNSFLESLLLLVRKEKMPWNGQRTATFNLRDNKQPPHASQCFLRHFTFRDKNMNFFSLQSFLLHSKKPPIVFYKLLKQRKSKPAFGRLFFLPSSPVGKKWADSSHMRLGSVGGWSGYRILDYSAV